MSFYRFNDTITLYTPIENGAYYERRVISAVKIQLVDSDEMEKTRATVYIPIFGRRSLKFRKPSERATSDRSSFFVTANQIVYLGLCIDERPPKNSYTVRTVETHLSGSRHAQHVKLVAYNVPEKEDEIYE